MTLLPTIPYRLYSNAGTVKRYAALMRDLHGRHRRVCPVCGEEGFFAARGSPIRYDALCTRCGSLERHRQHHLLIERNSHWIAGASVLHFAPERCFEAKYNKICSNYIRADFNPSRGELKIDIQAIDFADDVFDTIICHQVIEHVPDDVSALRELNRVLRSGGRVILSTPIICNWERTYRNESAIGEHQRDLHFGQYDHVRYYGRDLRSLIQSCGFDIAEDVAMEPDVSRFGLIRGHLIFVATKM